MNQQNIDFVLRSVEQRDIRFVRLWFVDILGRLKNFAISPEDLEVAFEEGIGFDGSAIEGFATPEEADMLAFPDASTFQILPWRPSHNGVARVFCDVCTPDRKPFAGDPRDALRRMFRKAEKAGYLLNVGAELEYYYFPDEHTPEPLDNVGYFDLSVSDAARDLRRNTVLTLEKMSVPVEYTFHAAGRSQHGMSLRHAEALSMSDAITTAKLIIKQQAYESGCHASFMPKPLAGEDGSAMFLHQSLFDHDGNNVFWGEDDEKYHLSEIAKHYMAGILAHAREISAITNPTVNSYKRITTGGDSVRHVGPAQPREYGPHPGLQARQAAVHAHRAAQSRPHGQPVPGQRRHAGGWSGRHRAQAGTPARGHGRDAQAYRPSDGRGRLRAAAALAQRGARRV